ncbi:MAG: hypothetical protein FJ290_09350 [Planctomycetes bacterium]|nr:hypothetical protein [Planctomycetota bacterium]
MERLDARRVGVGLLATLAAASCACCGILADAGEEPTAGTVILDTRSLWRFRTVRETREVLLPTGEAEHAQFKVERGGEFFDKNPDKRQIEKYTVEKVETVRLPSETPADWMKPGFDDSAWARLRGPMLDNSTDDGWKLIQMRGLFEVGDPARAGDLSLSLGFRGGAVVYLNGEEVGRAAMPRGEIGPYTLAEPYPDECYYTAEGFVYYRYAKDQAEGLAKRVRKATDLKIPAAKLRKGVNVLAVGIHRAPTDGKFFLRRTKASTECNPPHTDTFWAKIGLVDIRLAAAPGAAVAPNTGPLKGRGFKMWNQSVIQTVFLADYPDPFAPASPVRLTGVRNGAFCGQVIVGDDKPIRGLSVQVSDLAGPATIPASAVWVRYAVGDGQTREKQPRFFDSLEESPPDEVPVYEEHGGAVQPLWIAVRVPADAKAGDYRGKITITAEGIQTVSVPLELRLLDWMLPDVKQFTSCMDVVQSPESVAMAYDVPLWSDEHLKLLDKTFSLLAPLSNKTVFITAVRRTHFGNEHAMVRWTRSEDGELTPELSVVEKYLDVAVRRLGKIPGVILYAWEPPESQGHAGGAGSAARTADRPALITVVDPQTGKMSPRQGPAWGTPESQVFWKKLTDALLKVLAQWGLENSLLFGLAGDTRPTKLAMDDITNGVRGAKWAIHSHYYCDNWQGYDMGMTVALWGIGCQPADPSTGYSFGWSNPRWVSYFPREMKIESTLVEYRTKLENWMAARAPYTPFVAKGVGPRGLGRIGADFWPVLKDSRGRPRGTLAGRYPETAWGQLNLNNCAPYILGKGKNGPLATVRSEAFREALQELETRIFVEKALLDDQAKSLLGEELIGRCRKALDERIRMCLHSAGEGQPWFISSDWSRRSELLFALAAEVAKKMGREPRPNLTPEPKKR